MRKKLIELFSGGLKTSPTITKVDPFVPTTKAEKTARDLRRAVQKRKTSEVNLDNTIFKIKQETDKLKKQRDKNKKMGGGFMGKRMGYKGGSEKGKVPTTPKEKAFGMLSVKAKRDNNPNITLTDKIVGATKS